MQETVELILKAAIKAATDAAAPVQYGPYILLALTLIAGVTGWYLRTVLVTLSKHTTALAVLTTETRPGIKLVDEVIDLKVASAELDQTTKNHEARITRLESFQDNTNH